MVFKIDRCVKGADGGVALEVDLWNRLPCRVQGSLQGSVPENPSKPLLAGHLVTHFDLAAGEKGTARFAMPRDFGGDAIALAQSMRATVKAVWRLGESEGSAIPRAAGRSPVLVAQVKQDALDARKKATMLVAPLRAGLQELWLGYFGPGKPTLTEVQVAARLRALATEGKRVAATITDKEAQRPVVEAVDKVLAILGAKAVSGSQLTLAYGELGATARRIEEWHAGQFR